VCGSTSCTVHLVCSEPGLALSSTAVNKTCDTSSTMLVVCCAAPNLHFTKKGSWNRTLTHLRCDPPYIPILPDLLVAQLPRGSDLARSIRHVFSVDNCLLDSPEHHPPAKSPSAIIGHSGQVRGVWDDRSMVYSINGPGKTKAIVLLSFDPAINLKVPCDLPTTTSPPSAKKSTERSRS
jgi:hypothetical protein